MRHLCTINGHHYFRVRVPADFYGIFGCKEIKKAIRTSDAKTAVQSAKNITAELERVMNLIRSGILTDEQIKELVREFFNSTLKKSDTYRVMSNTPLDENAKGLLLEFFDFYVERLKGYLNNSATAQRMEGFVDTFLENNEISLDKASAAYRKLRRDFILALIEAYRIEKMRMKGNFNNWFDDFRSYLSKQETPQQLPQQQPEAKRGKLLSEVIAEYTKEKITSKAWNEKNRDETLAFYKQFVEIIGDREIKDYDREQLLRYQEILTKFPKNVTKHKELRDIPLQEIITLIDSDDLPTCDFIATRTINKHLVQVNSIFEYAQARNYCTGNPAHKLKVRDRKTTQSGQKDVYTQDDIKGLFTSSIYTKTKASEPEWFWIPLIGLYSGMRLGEICQLYKSDIKSEFGIPYFDINDEEDKKLKNKSAKRLVPISPVLLNLGFLSYVESVKHQRLWSNLERKRDGYGQDFSKNYNRYEETHVTNHPKKSFHSLRHTFITHLKDKIATGKAFEFEAVLKETVGHTQNSITMDRYGKAYRLELKLDLIKRVDYGIDMSHLQFPMRKD